LIAWCLTLHQVAPDTSKATQEAPTNASAS
jgi:hypothetical protein